MRCPCQDKPEAERIGCTMCGGTGVASCCETERPTWAPRDKGDERIAPHDDPRRLKRYAELGIDPNPANRNPDGSDYHLMAIVDEELRHELP